MTDAERLEEMRTEHHERVRSAKDAKAFRDSGWAAALGLSGRAGLMGYCDACERDWPCDTAVALAEVERLRGVARRAYDAFSLSAQYTDQERFLAMKALGLALGLVDPGAQVRPEAKP